ncbi:MAG: DUF1587 domain-containing protein, partial [Planctomycetia bacterium]|nr:DUF1587 domain-containing protein [Planctomycetia bacterium]
MKSLTANLRLCSIVAIAGVCLATNMRAPSLRAAEADAAPNESAHFALQIAPFLQSRCVACHSGDEPEGGIRFDKYRDSANVQTDYEIWETAARLIREHQMPPVDEEQPTSDEIIAITAAIEIELKTFDCSAAKHPGRVTLRRLNRAEYNNTIRDLVGLDLKLADDFPADDVGSGFDNIGDVLSIPPVLLEKYLAAGEAIAEAIFKDEKAKARVLVHKAASSDERVDVARRNVRQFATKAFRRPI